MSYAVQFTLKSRNAKVGAIPVSTTAVKTCPDACPLKASGCYAEAGPLGMMWRAMSKATPGSHYATGTGKGQGYAHDWQGFTRQIAALPEGALWRHNQAGDLPGEGNAIDAAALGELVGANKGRRGFTYTHKPLTTENATAIHGANKAGFTINVSANNLAHADVLARSNVAPVATVLPASLERGHTKSGEWTEGLDTYRARIADVATPEGRKVAVCPATYRDDVSCASCQLCQRATRKVIVGFPAHGASKRKASKVAETL
ncbi:DUF7227 family protein [Bradyrhizobium sp. USDA 4350]